jgi:hypothetical protein
MDPFVLTGGQEVEQEPTNGGDHQRRSPRCCRRIDVGALHRYRRRRGRQTVASRASCNMPTLSGDGSGRSSRSGWSGGRGSTSYPSRPAPAIRPVRSASIRAVSSTIGPRGQGAGIGSWSSRSCSGVMSNDFWMPSLRVPRPSVVFLLHGASMRLLVSSSIDFGSRLR